MDLRLDSAGLAKNYKLTREGFLIIKGSPTRVGVFDYYEPDGSIRHELRHPADVLKLDCLESMGGKPITVAAHPLEMLNPDNARNYQVGTTSNNVEVKYGPEILTVYNFHHKDAIDSIMARLYEQISLGYNTDVVRETGTFRGRRYDFRQTRIINNHHSVIKTGRAGKDCNLRFDSADVLSVLPSNYDSLAFGARLDGIPVKPQIFDMSTSKKDRPMAKIKISGVEYDVDDTLATAIRQDQMQFESQIQNLTTQNDQLQGMNTEFMEQLNQQLGDFEEHLDSVKNSSDDDEEEMDDEGDMDDEEEDTPPPFMKKKGKKQMKKDSGGIDEQEIYARIRAQVQEEQSVRNDAKFILDNYDEVEFRLDEGMSADDMRKHILQTCNPEKKSRFDSAEPAYLRGAYDAFIDSKKAEIAAEVDSLRADSENSPNTVAALKAQVVAGRLTAQQQQAEVLRADSQESNTLPAHEIERSQAWLKAKQSA